MDELSEKNKIKDLTPKKDDESKEGKKKAVSGRNLFI